MELKATQNGSTEIVSARIPMPLVARVEGLLSQLECTRSSFIIGAIRAAVERHEEEINGAGQPGQTVLQN